MNARELLVSYLPWALSTLTLIMSVATGNKWKHVWLFGLGIQCAWLTWILASRNYGFLPLTLSLFVIYARNHAKWKSG